MSMFKIIFYIFLGVLILKYVWPVAMSILGALWRTLTGIKIGGLI